MMVDWTRNERISDVLEVGLTTSSGGVGWSEGEINQG